MRFFACLIALCAWTNALAQDAPAPSEAEMQSARTISELFVDPSLMNEVSEAIIQQREGEIRNSILGSDLYRNLRPENQQALIAFADTLPEMFREELTTLLPILEREIIARLTARYSEAELAAQASLVGMPEFREMMREVALAQSRGEEYTPTPSPELDAAFEAARARGMPHQWDVVRIVGEANAAVQRERQPYIAQRVLRGACAAMGDQCPPHVQSAITPPN